MSFLHPQLLWLLALPALLLVRLAVPRRAASANPHPKIPRARLLNWNLIIGTAAPGARPFAACFVLAGFILALARPQGATFATPAITQSRDVLVAVDVSRSMLADDVAPSRLVRAQLLIRTLADELRGERLGLLPFAGTAFLQSPLSADYEIFRTFLDELGPDMIPAGGSDFAALLTAADEAFGPPDPTAPDAPPPADRYLVILSDGEAENETWKPLAQKLSARGVRILALGLGTAAGAMVPDGKGGLVKTPEGAAVLSKLDAGTLQELARLTDGVYRNASAWVDLPALLRDTVARGRARETTTDTAPRREELFAWFLAPALALLAISLVVEFPATPRPRRVSPPRIPIRHAASIALLLSLSGVLLSGPAAVAAETAPAEPPPDPLVSLVGELAAAAEPAPADLARLATLTAEQGEKARADQKSPFPEGAVRDALAATDQGRAAAPTAADWPALRSRLEALLAPPPQPPKPDEPQKDKKDPEKNQKKDSQENSKDDSPSPSEKSTDQKSSEGENQKPSPDSSPSPDSGGQPSSNSPSDQKSARPPSEKPLGDLGQKPESETPKPGESQAASPPKPEEKTPDEPTQKAGGVSASGQPPEGAAGAATAQIDPTLAVPQQRLERVRDADAPARLYQLLQEAETPPDAARRATGTANHDW